MNKENKLYQLNILFSPETEQGKIEEIIGKIKKKITDQNGSLSEEKNLLKRGLSYLIKKHREALNYTFSFRISPESVNKIREYLNSEERIIRHLLTTRKMTRTKPVKESLNLKMIDKIEPLKRTVLPELEKEQIYQKTERRPAPKKEKVKIEELDKKLKEILEG